MSVNKNVAQIERAVKLLYELGHKEPLSDQEIIAIFHDEIRRLQVERDLDNDELKDSLLGVEE